MIIYSLWASDTERKIISTLQL